MYIYSCGTPLYIKLTRVKEVSLTFLAQPIWGCTAKFWKTTDGHWSILFTCGHAEV